MFSTAFKRPREEDEIGFGEHETKKYRGNTNFPANNTTFALPSFISCPPALPPLSADQDHPCSDAVPESFREWREEKKPALQNRRPPTLTVDTAMDIDMVDSYPLQNGDNLSPWSVSATTATATTTTKVKSGGNRSQPSPIPQHLVSQSLNISGGRAATPIHGHFTLNMRPERMTGPNNNNSPVCAPSKTAEEAEWWRRRRLPSPISESGDIAEEQLNEPLASPPVHEEDALDTSNWPDSPSSMAVDSDSTPPQTFLQVPEQSIDIPARLYNDDHHMAAVSEPVAAATTTTPRKGKISFAMGYRADCEKCQMKVPGHYSHIVRS